MSRPKHPGNPTSATSRRQFLKQATAITAGLGTAGAIGFPTIVPSSALGKDGAVAPSNRIVLGIIGTGGQGRADMHMFMDKPDVQVVAVCDVDAAHMKQAMHDVELKYGEGNCKTYHDFRELAARKDLDAIQVTTPDHWHAIAAIAALDAGKDVYCEKPLANSVYEGRKIVDAVKRNNRILQTGTQERSAPYSRQAAELVQNGRIGKLHTIHINLPCTDSHHKAVRATQGVPAAQPVPEGFDYNTWLGHAPEAPYTEKRCHFWWRFILDYGGGEMTDRGAHVIDLGQLGNGTDETGPVEFEAKGERLPGSLYTSFWDYTFTNTYANGVKMLGTTNEPRGVKFEGSDGWVMVNVHGGPITASNPEILKEKVATSGVQLGRTPDHKQNFIDAMRTRKDPFAKAEIGHRTATICHLNNIAMATGKKLIWDPKTERITNEESLNALLKPTFRAPWTL
ncbi:MAG: oxidoreductase domain protein [Phycisphaerales bacterium]|nr:oxidoreductase domain protein [Phycisphaerales bacterium]